MHILFIVFRYCPRPQIAANKHLNDDSYDDNDDGGGCGHDDDGYGAAACLHIFPSTWVAWMFFSDIGMHHSTSLFAWGQSGVLFQYLNTISSGHRLVRMHRGPQKKKGFILTDKCIK